MSYEEEKQDRKIEQLSIKIEWLQNANTNFVRRICDQTREIERLRGELIRVNKLRETEIDQAGASERMYLEAARLKDARIKELEDALVEERARALWFEGDDPCDPPNLDWKTEPNDIPESVRLLWGESACQQLQAEGKIGPDAKPHDHTAEFFRPNESPAKSWQVTDGRVRAICWAEEMAGDCKAGDILRTMLEEAGRE